MESSQKVRESMAILLLLEQHGALGGEALANALALPLQTVNRTLTTLRDFKFVSKTTDRKWKLGISLLRIAATVPSQLLEVSKDIVEQLAQRTGGSAILAIPQFPNFVVIMERDGRQGPLRLESLASVGYPLNQAPPGIAILSHLPREQQHALEGQGPDAEEIRAQCEHVREFGWAVVPSQVIRGRHGIAAPIFDAEGAVAGSLTIALPSSDVAMLESFVDSLLRSTAAIDGKLRKLAQQGNRGRSTR
jgi:DNA-binding IclR family transcriptional regulator